MSKTPLPPIINVKVLLSELDELAKRVGLRCRTDWWGTFTLEEEGKHRYGSDSPVAIMLHIVQRAEALGRRLQ